MDATRPFNIMLSAAGRRVALLRILRKAVQELSLAGEVIPTDVVLTAATMHESIPGIVVPRCSEAVCLPFLLELAKSRGLRLIVPTIDPELPFYAANREAFLKADCRINISSVEAVAIGSDKTLTHQFLRSSGIPTVDQFTMEQALNSPGLPFPLIVKPRFGSGSVGVSTARHRQQLEVRAGEKNLVVQAIASGREYTADVYVDADGKCRTIVPRLRMETRGGEVSKAVTVRNPTVIDAARRVASALPGVRGVINIQIFHDAASGQANVIEINPRFGGGYPLSDYAGATMARWLIEESLGRPCPAHDDWREGVVMLRYDDAVFTDTTSAGVELSLVKS